MTAWLAGFALAFCVAVGARVLGWLTTAGALGAASVGTMVFVGAGIPGAGALLTFFVTSSLLTSVRKALRGEGRPRPRGLAQVLANGLPTSLAALLILTGDTRAIGMVAASLAAASADTWSTEIGRLLGREPRDIVRLRPVAAGESGGVTIWGFAASLAGASAIGVWFANPLAVITLGFTGSVVDSILGATLQARFRCNICGLVVEQRRHCGVFGVRTRGWSWVTNNTVNLLSVLLAGVLGYGRV